MFRTGIRQFSFRTSNPCECRNWRIRCSSESVTMSLMATWWDGSLVSCAYTTFPCLKAKWTAKNQSRTTHRKIYCTKWGVWVSLGAIVGVWILHLVWVLATQSRFRVPGLILSKLIVHIQSIATLAKPFQSWRRVPEGNALVNVCIVIILKWKWKWYWNRMLESTSS